MKKLFASLLVIALAVSFMACSVKIDDNNSDPSKNAASNNVVLTSGGRMAEVIGVTLNDKVNPYLLVYKIDVNGTELEITQAVKEGMVYMEFEYDGMLLKSLSDTVTGYHYAIYDSEKLIAKSTTPQTKIEPFDNYLEELNGSFTTGTQDINGTSYKYEKADGEGGYLTTYFDNKGKLCYMDANGTLMEIIAYDAMIDSSYFELPNDYTMMEM